MAKRSTLASLEKDIAMAQKIAKQMLTDLSMLKVGAAGLAALVCDLATELKELQTPEPVVFEDEPPDTSDGN